MKHTLWIVAVFALACASVFDQTTPASDAAVRGEVDPVRSYSCTTTVDGMAVDGQLQITGTRGEWGGAFHTP
ncbi:MAG: hypothetical protein KY466_06160 [Gemmatimonadetes bacterium]|nr:hypothetical protein [Gemmatimonadota bacterium]